MQNYQDKTDQELVGLSLQDKENFLYLMQRYEKILLHYIIRISGVNREDAEDILQEVFLKTYTNLNNYDPKLKFSSWIYRIAHNQTISQFRKKKARPTEYFVDEDVNRFVANLNIEEKTDLVILKDKLEQVLKKMDKKYREVLILKYLEEKDYNEISDILKKPVGTVGTLINRAKKKFKLVYSEITRSE